MNDKIADKQNQRERLGTRIKKRVIAGVKFLNREKRIIEKKEIESILPHRGRMLFLDQVIITAKKIIGEFLVTEEVCDGHEIGGQLMFKGVDFPEMTAQLLGVWLAQQADQYPNLNEKLAFFRKSSFKCISLAIPGDLLRVEIPVVERNEEEEKEGNPRIETISIEDKPERSRQQTIAINTEIWVGDKKKAVIYFVELGIVDAEKLS